RRVRLRLTARRTQPSTRCGPCHGWARISITPPARDTRTTMPWNRSCNGAFRGVSIPSLRTRGASPQMSGAVISMSRMDQAEAPPSKTTTIPAQPAAFRLTTSRIFYRGRQATSFRSAKRNDGRKMAWYRGSQAAGRQTISCRREAASRTRFKSPVTLRTFEEVRQLLQVITCGRTLSPTLSHPDQLRQIPIRCARKQFHKVDALRMLFILLPAGLIRARLLFHRVRLETSAEMRFVAQRFSTRTFLC